MTVANALSERTTDLYSTPPWAVDALLDNADVPGVIWEPACGLGAITKRLAAKGRTAVSTSLEHGLDFLVDAPEFDFDCIVTNPPFSIKNEFIERCDSYGKPYFLLMPLAALESQKRQAIWKSRRLVLLLPDRRIKFDRFDGQIAKSPNMVSAWFCVYPGQPPATEIKYISTRGENQ